MLTPQPCILICPRPWQTPESTAVKRYRPHSPNKHICAGNLACPCPTKSTTFTSFCGNFWGTVFIIQRTAQTKGKILNVHRLSIFFLKKSNKSLCFGERNPHPGHGLSLFRNEVDLRSTTPHGNLYFLAFVQKPVYEYVLSSCPQYVRWVTCLQNIYMWISQFLKEWEEGSMLK